MFGGCCHLLSKDMADPSPSSSNEILFILLIGIAFCETRPPSIWVGKTRCGWIETSQTGGDKVNTKEQKRSLKSYR